MNEFLDMCDEMMTMGYIISSSKRDDGIVVFKILLWAEDMRNMTRDEIDEMTITFRGARIEDTIAYAHRYALLINEKGE